MATHATASSRCKAAIADADFGGAPLEAATPGTSVCACASHLELIRPSKRRTAISRGGLSFDAVTWAEGCRESADQQVAPLLFKGGLLPPPGRMESPSQPLPGGSTSRSTLYSFACLWPLAAAAKGQCVASL